MNDSRYPLKATVCINISSILPGANEGTIDTETGPGVFETALAYTAALRMADNAVLFKYLAKSVGMKYGVQPSFMAKPWGNVSLLIFFLALDTMIYCKFNSSPDVVGELTLA